MTMKENGNQNATICDSKSFTRDTNPLKYGSKEIYELDDSRMNIDSLAFETKVSYENRKDIDDIFIDSESRTVDSPRKDDQNVLSDHISPEHKSSVTFGEFTRCNGNESGDSYPDSFEPVINVFTDKNVLECELPELDVIKDICIDDGRPANDKNSIGSLKDGKSSRLCPENLNDDNYCEAKEDYGKLIDQERFKSDKDTATHCHSQELVQVVEADCGVTDSGQGDSISDKNLTVQERTFLDSFDGEENQHTQPSDQVPIGKAITEGPATLSAAESNSLLYNSKVESRSITFEFSDTGQAQCTNKNIESLHDQSLTVEDKNPDDTSADSKTESVISKISKNVRDANSDDFSSEGQARSPSDKSQCSTNDDVPAVEPDDAKQELGNSGNDRAVRQWKNEEGESSFSAVTYSGPLALTGSLSYRSDASTASTRSFAFPILQSEWNSSPVRMAKADRRRFRKRKCWRSSILCCRF